MPAPDMLLRSLTMLAETATPAGAASSLLGASFLGSGTDSTASGLDSGLTTSGSGVGSAALGSGVLCLGASAAASAVAGFASPLGKFSLLMPAFFSASSNTENVSPRSSLAAAFNSAIFTCSRMLRFSLLPLMASTRTSTSCSSESTEEGSWMRSSEISETCSRPCTPSTPSSFSSTNAPNGSSDLTTPMYFSPFFTGGGVLSRGPPSRFPRVATFPRRTGRPPSPISTLPSGAGEEAPSSFMDKATRFFCTSTLNTRTSTSWPCVTTSPTLSTKPVVSSDMCTRPSDLAPKFTNAP
mmetsp:Transcript_11336/g.21595  ORF Transcript_11336/g.21595 Transcript_11336/m.21595 type:complete len:297 (+) Transcript_11336:152-1042(+)